MKKNKFIEQYFRENYNDRLKFARKRVGGYNLALAEEALQEAFYRALKYFPAYNNEEDFDSWFGKILVNCINDLKRLEGYRGVVHVDNDSGDVVSRVNMTKEIFSQLDKETKRNKEILYMYFFYGYKSREVSEFTGISHDVVRDVIRTFRKRIRDV